MCRKRTWQESQGKISQFLTIHCYDTTMNILPDNSKSKRNQTIKFGQLIEYNEINIFFENHAENDAGRLVPDLILFFKKVLYEVKASGYHLCL